MAVDHLVSGGESDTQRTCQSTNRCRSFSTGSLMFPLSLLFLMLMVVLLSSSLAAVMAVGIKEDGDGLLSLPPSLPAVTDTTMLSAAPSTADDEEAEREANKQQQQQQHIQVPSSLKNAEIEYEHFFNHGTTSGKNHHKFSKTNPSSGANNNEISSNDHLKLENEVIKSKVEVLGQVLKQRVQALRNVPGQRVELVFLVDSSASVGAENFFNELKFVRKLLADFTVSSDAARVAVVTFSSKNRVVRHIDHLTTKKASATMSEPHKCFLLEQELPAIGYTGGGTYTLGALLEAQSVLEKSRHDATKAVFLITDGYSNGGDPRPAAKRLREQGVRVFTFGIRNGNVRELFDMASEPAQEHSYIVDSFEEFEALARRALHEDLHTGAFLVQGNRSTCDRLCKEQTDCCHPKAECNCGTHTGHYACLCPKGHYGTGIKDDCHPCPGGTYRSEVGPGDLRSCRPCPDENHISAPGSTSVEQCTCPRGYVASEEDGGLSCQLLACPKLSPPRNGYFVKNACNSVFNGACGIRCNGGYKLNGSSIRLCQENGTWSGDEAECQMRSCGPVYAPKNGRLECSSEDYVIDSECSFSCNDGFTLVGSQKRVCLPIGYWDGLPAFCKPVYCNPLAKVVNGTLSPTKCSMAKMRYGDRCNATCAAGFELRGPSSRLCSGQGAWTDEDTKMRCVDVTAPEIKCPANVTLDAQNSESFASYSWTTPEVSDNSGIAPDLISVPAVPTTTTTTNNGTRAGGGGGVENRSEMRFRLGTSTVTYKAQDRRGNMAECSFHVTVIDREPPTVDQCESPPTYLLRGDALIEWDEPVFSDNSGVAPRVERSHENPSRLALGETIVTYTAYDEAGNNNTCVLTIRVQEHACHLPIDPIHGQANCTNKAEAIFCSLTCNDGFAFALPPPRNYFCAYDGQWLPADNPLPFPDCSITTHSDQLIQDGVIRIEDDKRPPSSSSAGAGGGGGGGLEKNEEEEEEEAEVDSDNYESNRVCSDPFLMSQMESHLKRRLAARLNEICGDNLICEIDDLQAECRHVMTGAGNTNTELQLSVPNDGGQKTTSAVDDDDEDDQLNQLNPIPMLPTRVKRNLWMEEGEEKGSTSMQPQPVQFQQQMTFNMPLLTLTSGNGSSNGSSSNPPVTLEFRFKISSRFPAGGGNRTAMAAAGAMLEEMKQLRSLLTESALGGDFNIQSAGRSLNVFAIEFNDGSNGSSSDRLLLPRYKCPAGSVPVKSAVSAGRESFDPESWAKCVYCPVGTFFNVVNEICEACHHGSYQPLEGQLSCLVCPHNTSTKVTNAKRPDDCQAQCLAGSYSPTGLEPCSTCPLGTYQSEYSQRYCSLCPPESTTFRRGARRIDDCKSVCPPGHVSETGLAPCFACPPGFYQPLTSQKFCIRCPRRSPFTSSSGTVNRIDCQVKPATSSSLSLVLPEPTSTEEFEEASLLEVNDCFSLPCLNGGQCHTLDFGYVCRCPPGFTGMQCESDIDECDSSPCLNGATCSDGVNSYQCHCAVGFVGSNCQTDVDECASGPCEAGATCLDVRGGPGYTCICPEGIVGLRCELEVDECVSQPCQNGGSCFDRMANYTCVCAPGWTGKLCEEAIDECLSQPCSNGGTCEDLVGSFVCHCPAGFDGSLCEKDVNECEPSPCAAGSTCIDRLAAFVCLCPPGVVGATCDSSVRPDFSLLLTNSPGRSLDYAVWERGLREPSSPVLTELTLCAWMRTEDQNNYGTVFSFATDTEANALTLTDYSGFVFYVNGDRVVTDVTANDGQWHLICVTWSSLPDGNWHIYADGQLKDKGTALAANSSIATDGFVVLGQEQDQRAGGFSDAESFIGQLYGIELWNTVLTEGDISDLTVSCPAEVVITGQAETGGGSDPTAVAFSKSRQGNVLTWADFKHGLHGGVVIGESPFCRGCPDPMAPLYGIVQVSGANEAIYTCNLGYTLTPSSFQLTSAADRSSPDYDSNSNSNSKENRTVVRRNCMVHGGWNGPEPECQRVQCGFPGYILNGLVNGSSAYAYGDTVKYNCTRGFKLSGNASRTCQDNGQWSNEPPECLPVTCDAPNSPANGSFVLVKRLQTSSSTTPLSLDSVEDYANGGGSSVATTFNPVVAGYAVGDRIQFTCLPGFRLDGPSSLSCLDEGQWEDVMPICQPLACTHIPYVENGVVANGVGAGGIGDLGESGGGFTPGYVLTFACRFGYQLESTGQVQCDHEGFWMGRTPKCLPIRCGPVPQVANAVVKLSASLSSSSSEDLLSSDRVGSTASYSCEMGYELFGPVELECTERAIWMDRNEQTSIPVCMPIDCGPLPLVENGNVYAEDQTYGSIAQLTCYDGYKRLRNKSEAGGGDDESDRIECGSDKQWSGSPKCAPIACTDPPTPIRNGTFVPADNFFAAGESVSYTCQDGFQLSDGASEFVCTETGTWVGELLPSCLPVACPTGPPQIEFGSWNYSSASSDGDGIGGLVDKDTIFYTGAEILYWCDEGYYLAGDPRRRCFGSAGWLPSTPPICRRLGVARSASLLSSINLMPEQGVVTCPPLENPEHGTILIDGFTPNQTASYECDTGFQMQGPSQLVCSVDGKWIVLLDVDAASADGNRNDTFKPVELSSSSSIGGVERSDSEETATTVFLCEPVFCADPPAPVNGSVRFTSLSFGSKAIFSCDKGFVLNGSQQRTCGSEGEWIGGKPTRCVPRQCSMPEIIEHGYIGFEVGGSVTSLGTGSTILYDCEEGYKVVGVRERVCLANGDWSEEEPRCELIYCEKLPERIPHGTVTGAEEPPLYAAVVQFACDPGYELHGEQKVTCEDDERWSAPIPECQPVHCPFPGLVPHAKASLMQSTAHSKQQRTPPSKDLLVSEQVTEYQYGDVLNYTCRKGYTMRSANDPTLGGPYSLERSCLADGTWSSKAPVCTRIFCPPFVIPQNGFASLPFEAPSSQINSSSSLPLQNASLPSGGDDEVDLSTVTTATTSTPAGSGQVVKFGCNIGYKLAAGGSLSAECLESGQWSVSKGPVCERVQCPQPPSIKNGKTANTSSSSTDVARKEYFYKDQIEYVCDFGFRLDLKKGGQRQLNCTATGAWGSSPPICVRAICPFRESVDQLENGHITPVYPPDALKSQNPSALKFSCRSGYELIGSSTTQCQSNSEWSHTWPTCKWWPCDAAPMPPHGRIMSTEMHSSGEFIMAILGCDSGYVVSNESNLTCGSSGTWKGHFDCHPLLCSPPERQLHEEAMKTKHVKHAAGTLPLKLSDPYKFGDRIYFECEKGYRPAESTLNTSLVCGDEGRWQGQIPSCPVAITCSSPQALSFGSVTLLSASGAGENNQTKAVYGATATFTCNPGFLLKGPERVTCQLDGKWSSNLNKNLSQQQQQLQLPVCIALTCNSDSLVAPENGWMVVHGVHVGDTVTYTCKRGFHISGERERRCLATGEWSGQDPACDQVICAVPNAPQHSTWTVSSDGFIPGGTIRFECLAGYTLVGSHSITCLTDKTWSDEPPSCQMIACPALGDPEHGQVRITKWTTVGDQLLSSANEMSAKTSTATYSYRSVAHYECLEGYQLFGPERRTCTDQGTWSERGPQCQRVWCEEPQPPLHGFVMGTGRQYGDKVRYACSAGFRLRAESNENVCNSSGLWSKPAPQCQVVTCESPPPHVHHATLVLGTSSTVVDNGTSGSWSTGTYHYRCNQGYHLVGADVITVDCLPNEQWAAVVSKGHCQKALDCNRPTALSKGVSMSVMSESGHSTPAGNTFKFGDRLVVTCPPSSSLGHRRHRVNSAVLTCQADGQWLGQAPICGPDTSCDLACLNGGSCQLYSTPTSSGRRCSCPHGYYGNLCQHAHCILPCLHGGTCVSPYLCACRLGYTGNRCQTAICESPCLNGGRCVAPNVCHCPAGTILNNCRKRNDFFSPKG